MTAYSASARAEELKHSILAMLQGNPWIDCSHQLPLRCDHSPTDLLKCLRVHPERMLPCPDRRANLILNLEREKKSILSMSPRMQTNPAKGTVLTMLWLLILCLAVAFSWIL